MNTLGTLTPFVTPTVQLSRLFEIQEAEIYAKFDLL